MLMLTVSTDEQLRQLIDGRCQCVKPEVSRFIPVDSQLLHICTFAWEIWKKTVILV